MFVSVALAVALGAQVALTPPMGWNSYDCFGYSVTEQQVMDNAEFMDRNLRTLGWNYVVIDYIWSAPRLGPTFGPEQNEKFEPRLAMDAHGRLQPDLARFPSSAGGKGFRVLSDRLHKLGLRFGIHLMRGIPRQAVADKCPIEGSPFSATDAADPSSKCPWLNQMFGLNMTSPAGQAYLDSIFRLYARWGVDFVKVDDVSRPYSAAEVEGYRKAIDRCGRPIVLSLSPGPTPLENAEHVAAHANMWRLLDDLWDNYPDVAKTFDQLASWTKTTGPGHWPDPDMLPLGRLRKYGPQTGPPDTDSRLTPDEQTTLMTLWCIANCPLMFGGNLPETPLFTLSLIENEEAIEADQSGHDPKAVGTNPDTPVWMSKGKKFDEIYIAVFNQGEVARQVNVKLNNQGLKTCAIRDIWAKKDLGDATTEIDSEVPAHGARFYRLKFR